MSLVTPGHYLHNSPRTGLGWLAGWQDTFRLAWGSSMIDGAFAWRGHRINTWTANLNTALRVGNDPLKLAARLEGQCEVHAWVDGPNRAWLAGIIDEGLAAGLFRGRTGPDDEFPQGWEDVVALLRARDDEPVVTSYSIEDGFPEVSNSTFDPERPADWMPTYWDRADWDALTNHERDSHWAEDGRADLYSRLSSEEQWRHSMEWLRARPGMLELTPETWSGYYFGNGLSTLDLRRADWERRLNEAFDIEPEPADA